MAILRITTTRTICFLLTILPRILCLGHAIFPAGTIEKTTKHLVLASLPPNHESVPTSGSYQVFLTSPSGKYAAVLLRSEYPFAAGGSGNDFCCISIQETGGGERSVWESHRISLNNDNTCTLVFSDAGFEIFDGSHSAWDTGTDGEVLKFFDLLDDGDIEIKDQNNKAVWKASDGFLKAQNLDNLGAPKAQPSQTPFGDDAPPRRRMNQPLLLNSHIEPLSSSRFRRKQEMNGVQGAYQPTIVRLILLIVVSLVVSNVTL